MCVFNELYILQYSIIYAIDRIPKHNIKPHEYRSINTSTTFKPILEKMILYN